LIYNRHLRGNLYFHPALSLQKQKIAMQLKPVATFDSIDPELFRKEFYEPGLPVVIKNLSQQ